MPATSRLRLTQLYRVSPCQRYYIPPVKLVYTNENRFLVLNAQNLVLDAGIAVILKNEFVGGGSGELSPFDTWLELWVIDDSNCSAAVNIIESAFSNSNKIEWQCNKCNEVNDASFEICWNCQTEKKLQYAKRSNS